MLFDCGMRDLLTEGSVDLAILLSQRRILPNCTKFDCLEAKRTARVVGSDRDVSNTFAHLSGD